MKTRRCLGFVFERYATTHSGILQDSFTGDFNIFQEYSYDLLLQLWWWNKRFIIYRTTIIEIQ